ncbi:hypothetical protein ABK040_015128 [Willaertia magna]
MMSSLSSGFPEPQLEDGKLTNEYLRRLCRSKGGYMTEDLNDKLYLQHKGITKIENLEKFVNVKVIWLDGNAIHVLENLGSLEHIVCLYLHQNCIEEIKGIFHCKDLHTLNISQNFIESIPAELGLSCYKLQTLDLSNNRLGTMESIKALEYCRQLSILDLSNNNLFKDIENDDVYSETIDNFLTILKGLSELRLLRLQGNHLVKKIPSYRKTVISTLSSLNYLDEMPVFEEEKRTAKAWKEGGVEAEREERKRIANEKKEKEKRNFEAFEKLIQKARERREDSTGESSSKGVSNNDEVENSTNTESLFDVE